MGSKSLRIYIAGHKGLIGSSLVRALSQEGYSNLITATRSELDLTNKSQVDSFFGTHAPEVVFLCAGRVGGIQENQNHPVKFMTDNLMIQLNVLEASHKSHVKKLFFYASSCMYPRRSLQPMREEYLLTGSLEETSLPYALSKLSGTFLCEAYKKEWGDEFMTLIPNTVYGPFDHFDETTGHVIPSLIRRFHDAKINHLKSVTLWGSGLPRREFIYSDDVANATLFLMNYDTRGLKFPLNVGSGRDVTILELSAMIKKIVGYEGVIEWDQTKPDGASQKLLDSSRILSLGWSREIELERGLAITYDWFLSHSENGKA